MGSISTMTGKSRWTGRSGGRVRHELNLLVAVVCVLLLTSVIDVQHNYWSAPGLSAWDLTRQTSMLGLYALGAAVVIISGGIDLSTGSVMALGGTVCAAVLLLLAPQEMIQAQPLPLWVVALALLATLATGFLVGSLHAWLITVVGLPPFIATLGTLVGLRSLARAICESVTQSVQGGKSTQINLFDPSFLYFARSVWIPAVLLLVLAAIVTVLLSRTVPGRHLYALGGNEQAARLSGIRTDRLKWLAYVLSAVFSSLAGVIAICDQGVAEPQTLGRGAELHAIAAAVVGGCSLQGGVGTIPGTLLGALFLRAVIDGVAKIIKTGADVYEGLVVGIVVVCAVTFTQAGAGAGHRKQYFAGALGLATVLNLTLLAAAAMALVGAGYLGNRVQLETGWLALWTGITTFVALLILRNESLLRRQTLAVAWLLIALVGLIAADRAYPGWQQRSAVALVRSLGGTLSREPSGAVAISLRKSSISDRQLGQLASVARFFPQLSELDLSETPITDAGLAQLNSLRQLNRLRLDGTTVTPGSRLRLKRQLPDLQVTP